MSKEKKKGRSRKTLLRNIIIVVLMVVALFLTVLLTGIARDRNRVIVDEKNAYVGMEGDEENTSDTSMEAITEATTKFMNDDDIGPVEAPTEEVATSGDTKEASGDDAKIEKLLSDMTLEEKVHQMFFISPESLTGYETVVKAGDATKEALEKHPVGGLCYSTKNLVTPEQTKELIENTQKIANEVEGMPLITTLDEEGGRVTRMAKNSSFNVTKIGPMGDVKDKDEAFAAGDTIGKYISEYGFNLDFAPDSDVLTNPDNEVIGDRSFGSDPEKVTECSVAFSDGLHKNNVMSTFKHFPGHGGTDADTHEGYAYTNKTYEELKKDELIPFMAAEENGVEFVMVAHISLPKIIGDTTPSTLSKKIVTDMLRNDIGYTGIIITDSMDMGAVSKKYSAGDAAVMAIEAGNDVILEPADFEAAVNAVINAVKSGKISEERINESVRRILKAKLKLM